ncbi:hypothetical protein A2U01_0109661 [Trifolium medium]|uniref:Uncharacterized protein n=1 Tax=Trifolium medium TaxID=97028 RepID=A0A392VJ09_9FABA|nr:hypothetical protein [Trifolium medium]
MKFKVFMIEDLDLCERKEEPLNVEVRNI